MAADRVAERQRETPGASPARPRREPVLPPALYAILVAEAIGCAWLYAARDVRASDPIGHAAGWIGTASMLLMQLYSVRRRVRALARFGRLSRWLQGHIFLGLQGAILVTFHSLHLSTLANLSGATIAMTIVVAMSGVFGRYVYARLPRGSTGIDPRAAATWTAAERVFRRWTIVHRPLTILLAGTVALHVIGHYVYAAAYGR